MNTNFSTIELIDFFKKNSVCDMTGMDTKVNKLIENGIDLPTLKLMVMKRFLMHSYLIRPQMKILAGF